MKLGANFEQVIGLALEQAVFHRIGFVDMFLRENGGACGDPADQGQGQLGQTG